MTVNGVPHPLPKMHSGLRRSAQAHTRRPDSPPRPHSRADRAGQRRVNNTALRQAAAFACFLPRPGWRAPSPGVPSDRTLDVLRSLLMDVSDRAIHFQPCLGRGGGGEVGEMLLLSKRIHSKLHILNVLLHFHYLLTFLTCSSFLLWATRTYNLKYLHTRERIL